MLASLEPSVSSPEDVILAKTPLRIGGLKLRVRDLDRVAGFYRQLLGLQTLRSEAGLVALGAGGRPLLELQGDPAFRARNPRSAGLFHTAFLMPTRGDLAAWLRSAVAQRVALDGASDHGVSEAIYLSDPEGNGVEIYADRPSSVWRREAGMIAMRTDPLDARDLMGFEPDRVWNAAPEGLVVGHMHLQAGALTAAEAFYRDVLGFDVSARYPGATFYGAGGYHHQLATNIWNSRNAGPIDEAAAGLAQFELRASDPSVVAEIERRARAAGQTVETTPEGLVLRDPWGLRILVNSN